MHLMTFFITNTKALCAIWTPNTALDFDTQSRSYKKNLPTEIFSLCVVGDSESESGYFGGLSSCLLDQEDLWRKLGISFMRFCLFTGYEYEVWCSWVQQGLVQQETALGRRVCNASRAFSQWFDLKIDPNHPPRSCWCCNFRLCQEGSALPVLCSWGF